MLTSLIFTLWMGMGQTVALYLEAYTNPTKEVSVEGCPADWIEDMENHSGDDDVE